MANETLLSEDIHRCADQIYHTAKVIDDNLSGRRRLPFECFSSTTPHPFDPAIPEDRDHLLGLLDILLGPLALATDRCRQDAFYVSLSLEQIDRELLERGRELRDRGDASQWSRTARQFLPFLATRLRRIAAQLPQPPDAALLQKLSLREHHMTILQHLNEATHPVKQPDIATATDIGDGKIKAALPALEHLGLVHRPHGKRSGYQITARGRTLFPHDPQEIP